MALHRCESPLHPASLHWPLELLASSTIAPAPTNIPKSPTITISPPSPPAQSLQPTPKALDPSKLHPKTIPTPNRPEPLGPISKKRKHDHKDDYHNLRHAPSPSLFCYNLCRNDACPIKLAHEKGTFRYLGQGLRIDDEKARELVEKLFGGSNPPRFVWDDVAVVVQTARERTDV